MRKLSLYGFFVVLLLSPVSVTARAADIPYTALGDSYSAGEGNDPFDGSCHRALRVDSAYPRILPALSDYVAAPNFHACTGAVTADVWQHPQPNRRGQAVQTSYVKPQDLLVTLTIGGNDLHFASILRECLLRFDCSKSKLAMRVEAELGAIETKLARTYEQVRAGMNPRGYLLVAGYPHLFALDAAGCNPLISPRESAWVDRLVDRGNSRIAAAVGTAHRASGNVFFIGAAREFAGHELCSARPWLHGLKLSLHEGLNLLQGSYHPTPSGQRAYAAAFAEFLNRPSARSALTG
jgi:GDSL-like Lipase/Acylhydrolase family